MTIKSITTRPLVACATLALLGGLSCDDQDETLASDSSEAVVDTNEQAGAGAPTPLADHAIKAAVDRELFYDPSIPSEQLKVAVTDGVVSLTGSAPHLLARDRATHVASAVKGVRAINNRLQVTVPERDDAAVRAAVLGELSVNPSTERFDVSVSVQDQVVTLTGTVQSRQEKLWAERTARSIVGVKDVVNDVEVEYRTNRRDAEILEDVRASLRWDNVVNDGLVEAHVDNGYVTLTGIVGTLAERRRAENNAWVAGVKGVDGRKLEIEWWAKEEDLRRDKYLAKSDREIESALEDALLFDPRVNSFRVTPKVVGGIATLEGTVSTLAAKNAAERIAEHTVGVASVKNEIEVDPGTVLDPALEARLREALKRNVLTHGYGFEIDVDRGVAKLEGTVDNYSEKAEAEIIASTVAGIRDVQNNLAVTTPVVFVFEMDDFASYPYVAPWASRVSSAPLKGDLEMKNDIERELEWSPYVSADSVEVRVQHGVATLTGSASSLRELEAATANAYQGGAVQVDNRLKL